MHSIRLRHPWQCEQCDDTAVWSRKFNWPAESTPGEIIQLVIEPISSGTVVSLNGTSLKMAVGGHFDITLLMTRHNRLTITAPVDSSDDPGKCPFDVRLEIGIR